MTDTATAPEELTPEQLEAELQARLDKTDAKLRGEDEPAAASEPSEPASEPDPMKLDAEPGSEADTEPATGSAEKPAEGVATPATDGQDKPAAEPAKPASPALDAEDEAAIAALPEAAQGALRARLAAAAESKAELTRQNAKLAQDNRSMSGRVSAYQRRYEEATGKRQPAEKPAVTPEQTEAWKNFQDEYPEIATAIEARFAASLPEGAAAKTQELLQYVEDQKRDAFLRDAWAAVEAVHPTWRADGSTREFAEWKKSSPTYEKLAASDDIADAIALFDLYEAHKGRTNQGNPDPVPAKPAPTPAAPANTAAADQVAARREKQAEGARTPSGNAATPNPNVDLNDADQLFNFYAKNADARLKRR